MTFIEPGASGEPVGPEPVALPVEPAPLRPETDAPPAESADATAEPESFDRAYVEELRREAAGYRTRLREEESVWDGYDPEDRAVVKEYIRLQAAAQRGDEDAARRLREEFTVEDDDEPAPLPGDQADPLEAAREAAHEAAMAVYQEQENVRAQREAVAGVRKAAEDMGYTHMSEDYVLLLKYANDVDSTEHPDVLKEADKKVKAYHRAIYEKHIAAQEQQNDGQPRVPSGQGTSADITQAPKTWEEAHDSAHRRMTA